MGAVTNEGHRRGPMGYRFNWRAGASLPSRTTGAIFLYIYISLRALHTPYISKCFYVNFFKRNHRVQRSTS